MLGIPLRIVFVLLYVSHQIDAGGSGPVLIKMGGKKEGKKGGNLILISGGKCGSPTLIKGGGGKKGGGEMILVGGQNNCEPEKKVHVVKQLVPVPYYVPKPVFKYILRHHYVPVRQVVVKPVPVPYPVKTTPYKKSYESSYSGGYGGGGYESGSDYGSSSPYDSDPGSAYHTGGKYYSGTSNYEMNYDESSGGGSGSAGASSAASNPAGSGVPASTAMAVATSAAGTGYQHRQSYESTPYSASMMPSSGGSSMMMNPMDSAIDYHQTSAAVAPTSVYKSSSAGSSSYFYQKPYEGAMTYGSPQHYVSSVAASSGDTTASGYRLYAPVYSGPNGQLYTTNQVFNDTGLSTGGANPSITGAGTYSSELNHATMGSASLMNTGNDYLRLSRPAIGDNSVLDRSSGGSSKKKSPSSSSSSSSSQSSSISSSSVSSSSSSSSYKTELGSRAKKLFTEPFSALTSGSRNSNNKNNNSIEK